MKSLLLYKVLANKIKQGVVDCSKYESKIKQTLTCIQNILIVTTQQS